MLPRDNLCCAKVCKEVREFNRNSVDVRSTKRKLLINTQRILVVNKMTVGAAIEKVEVCACHGTSE
jgi:hypothetical protein